MYLGLEEEKGGFDKFVVFYVEWVKGGVGFIVIGGISFNILGWVVFFVGRMICFCYVKKYCVIIDVVY